MEAFVYILFSESLNKYCVGSTELSPEKRLELHLVKFYGTSKFTAKTEDWQLRFSVSCNSVTQARKIEHYLKRMRNRKYLEWLIDNHEAVEKIKLRF